MLSGQAHESGALGAGGGEGSLVAFQRCHFDPTV